MRIAPVDEYIHQAACYKARRDNMDYKTAKAAVKCTLRTLKESGTLKDPLVPVNFYTETRDKKKAEVPLTKLLNTINKNNLVVAPSMTAYIPATITPALLAGFTVDQVAVRSAYKKKMFQAEAAKDMQAYDTNNGLQNAAKFVVNSISGAEGSEGTALSNTTGHSSLTSTIRMVTSTGSILAERLLGGNRAYLTPEDVTENLAYVISLLHGENGHSELYASLESLCAKYRLHIPTPNEVIEVITHSTHRYWYKGVLSTPTQTYIQLMSDIERVAFCYLHDLYHLRKFNPDLVRFLLTEMSVVQPVDPDSVKPLKSYRVDDVIHAHILNYGMCAGKGMEYDTLFKKEEVKQLADSCQSITDTLGRYSDLFTTLFDNEHTPSNTVRMGEVVRETVLLSDTDSTGLTTDEWVRWYTQDDKITETAFAVSSSLIYIFTTYLVKQLEHLSRRMGVAEAEINRLAMKNEYFWSVFIVALSKHYYANTVIREGRIYEKPKLEKKGVHLLNSAMPRDIMAEADSMLKSITHDMETDGKVSLLKYIDWVLDIEKRTRVRIKAGDGTCLRSITVQSASAYKDEEDAVNYQQYQFWCDVFGPDYGILPTPIAMVKVNLTLKNKTALMDYLTTDGGAFKKRWLEHAKKTDKWKKNTVFIPRGVVEELGIIPEILPVTDITQITLDLCKVFYIILSTLGYHKPNDYTLTDLLLE